MDVAHSLFNMGFNFNVVRVHPYLQVKTLMKQIYEFLINNCTIFKNILKFRIIALKTADHFILICIFNSFFAVYCGQLYQWQLCFLVCIRWFLHLQCFGWVYLSYPQQQYSLMLQLKCKFNKIINDNLCMII